MCTYLIRVNYYGVDSVQIEIGYHMINADTIHDAVDIIVNYYKEDLISFEIKLAYDGIADIGESIYNSLKERDFWD